MRFFALVIATVGIAYLMYAWSLLPCIPTRRITVASTSIWVCVADTPTEQTRGLSYSRYLPKKWGMLFVFSDYSHHQFWMKDMRYPIDILWLNDDLEPVEVARGAHPDSYPGLFTPVYANRFVLETRPGVVPGAYDSVSISDE